MANQQSIVTQGEYSGPIPPPSYLKEYEQLMPGLADRIMTLAEQDAVHVRKIQEMQATQAMKTEAAEACITKRGQLFAMVIILLFFFGGITLLLMGDVSAAQYMGIVSAISGIGLGFLKYLPYLNKRSS